MLSIEEKKRFLKALEEDLEFRYAIMDLLGFKEILDRITRLEERQQRLEERQQKLEERFAQLEERFIKLEERVARIEEGLEQLSRTVTVIAHRFDILTEKGFRETMKLVVEDIPGVGCRYC